jgi:hypothetical protein
LEKDDYYCGAISFLPLRVLISSWSITWNHRSGKFSDEQFSLHKKRRISQEWKGSGGPVETHFGKEGNILAKPTQT